MGNKEDLGMQWSDGDSHKKRILVAISQNAKHFGSKDHPLSELWNPPKELVPRNDQDFEVCK